MKLAFELTNTVDGQVNTEIETVEQPSFNPVHGIWTDMNLVCLACRMCPDSIELGNICN